MNDAKDTTLKVTAGLKDAVNQLGAQLGGMTQREVVEYLLGLHRAKQEQEGGRPIPALDQLRRHFERIEAIYTEWVNVTWDQEERYTVEIARLQAALEEAKRTVYEQREQLQRMSEQQAEQIAQIQAESTLVQETWAREREEMAQRLAQAQATQEQAAQLASLAQTVCEEAKRRAATLEARVQALGELEQKHTAVLARLQETERELERIRERMPLELDKAVLDTERRHLTLIAELRESLAQAREENALLKIRLNQP
ncbi:hypothetical protein [Alicyclobacillus macrosporangiidus]|uniref:Uncharacterized protein n=1 Tax=Alicyclobacillus macrosporangiidus TaxID=392015 RepID=A0A1I7LCD8_9BACL|nr:hypothetical protein [Alicyclobacillus macrosporangiidus]SFV07330.1 hypothetical protein SAMN05421543_13511 [Alicyclobacillus macrosporangiidus]